MKRVAELNTAIELHDSVLSRLERRGTQLIVTLTAYVHRSAGRPGIDGGSGWTQTARLILRAGSAHGDIAGLPFEISDGHIESAAGVERNVIPVPWPHGGAAELHLLGMRGERALLIGQALTIQWVSAAVYVEEFRGHSPTAAFPAPESSG